MNKYAGKSLYEILGKDIADKALRDMLDSLYEAAISDEDLSPFFQGVDLATLKKHVHAFCAFAFGGARNYNGLDLNRAHKRVREQVSGDGRGPQAAPGRPRPRTPTPRPARGGEPPPTRSPPARPPARSSTSRTPTSTRSRR